MANTIHILHLEDNEQYHRDWYPVLEKHFSGCQITWCDSVKTAKDKIEKGNKFNVILLDIGLGRNKPNGLVFYHWLRIEKKINTPVLVLSIIEFAEDQEKIDAIDDQTPIANKHSHGPRKSSYVISKINKLTANIFAISKEPFIKLNQKYLGLGPKEYRMLKIILRSRDKPLNTKKLATALVSTSGSIGVNKNTINGKLSAINPDVKIIILGGAYLISCDYQVEDK